MDVTLPNGVVVRGIPEGTDKYAIMEKAIAKGLAKPEDFGQESADPSAGMSGLDKFRAGWGKSVYDLGRGVGQMTGLVSRQDVANSRERDAPLMQSGLAKTGNIAGSVANFLPTAFIPGANTVAGATAIGAGAGLLQPSVSTGETLLNTALGGALGGGSLLAARGAGALYRGGKAIVEPFLKGGQDRIAARALTAFAGGTDDAARAAQNIAQNASDVLPGMQPTTAELAQNAGLSQLERTLRNNPELTQSFASRLSGNRNAILSAVDDIAGDASRMNAATAARNTATEALYDTAKTAAVPVDDALTALLRRPSMKKAWEVAANLASENGQGIPPIMDMLEQGINPADLKVDGNTLHYLKMAMDDLADNPMASGIGGNEVRAINSTKNALIKWIGEKIPAYDSARTTYAAMSKPINQMEVGQALRDKLVPALADYGPSTRMRPESFAQALRNGDATAARTLGRSSASIKDIMTPEQMASLNQIGRQLSRRVAADEAGKAIGSNTGQNIVSQNFMRQLLGPLGLPESTMQRAAQSTIAQSVMRPMQFASVMGEQQVLQRLAEASLDPALAKKMLEQGIKPEYLAFLRYQALYGPAGAAAGVAAAN